MVNNNSGRRKYYRKKQQKDKAKTMKIQENNHNDDDDNDDENNNTSDNENNNSTNADNIIAIKTQDSWFHWTTRIDLVKYLRQYRKGCIAYYKRTKWEQDNPDLTLMVEEESESNNNFSSSFDDYGNKDHVLIGGYEFPILNDTIYSEPYMIIPFIMKSNQRKIIHECCVEADVYHTSYNINDSNNNNNDNNNVITGTSGKRNIVISAYADGLECFVTDNTNKPKTIIKVHHLKPWFCRKEQQEIVAPAIISLSKEKTVGEEKKDSKVDDCIANNEVSNSDGTEDTPESSNENTKDWKITVKDRAKDKAMKAIYQLLDQPGECLREDLDTLYYEKLSKASLADIEPPSIDDNDNNNTCSSLMIVDTAEKMKQCIQELNDAHPSEIAFDIEAYNISKYTQLTCLLQIAYDSKEYVIDTLVPEVWDEVHGLASIFADPTIVKIGHSIGGLDVKCLHRDFGIFVINAFDTYEAAQVLNLHSVGLAAVCDHYGLTNSDHYVKLKTQYQVCDWRIRPLSSYMIQYARYDVHYLIRLRLLMMRDIVYSEFWGAKDSNEQKHEDMLVAQSLNETLRKIQMAEDDDIILPTSNNDNNFTTQKKNTTIDVLDIAKTNSSFESSGDDMSFKSSLQNMKSDDDLFYTPSGSLVNMSYSDDGGEYHGGLTDDDDDEDDDESSSSSYSDTRLTADITVKYLRLHPVLMSCLSTSQVRCLDIWTGRLEPHLNNAFFTSLIKRWKRGKVTWHPSSTELYDGLYKWRNSIAKDLECLPGFVSPLELLVSIAWKRPTTQYGLQRISYELPPALDENNNLQNELLNIVLSKSLVDGASNTITTSPIYFYSDIIKNHNNNRDREINFDINNKNRGTVSSVFGKVVGGSVCMVLLGSIISIHLNAAKRK